MTSEPIPPSGALFASPRRIVAIGECMVELSRQSNGGFALAYGGDTFNTAAYLARAGETVAYATALGDDPYSDGIASLITQEGVAGDLVVRLPGRMPGLYMIETTTAGERSFWYWRDRAAARDVFASSAASVVVEGLAAAGVVYVSGITLSIYDAAGLDQLEAAIRAARGAGATIVMDGNYRPRGWGGDPARARATFERFWRLSDVALPTFDDEQALWGDSETGGAIARLRGFRVREICLKEGPAGATIALSDTPEPLRIACPQVIAPIDTTAAGDSFNAGYIAARRRGVLPGQAVLAGHRLAGVVIQHRGAIVPRAATAAVLSA